MVYLMSRLVKKEQQQFSYHQCTKCGMIYRCEKDSCKMPFLYDICHMCQKRFFYFNPWFYFNSRMLKYRK
jgi:NAD-dependent SIR2 family protein deacetylase